MFQGNYLFIMKKDIQKNNSEIDGDLEDEMEGVFVGNVTKFIKVSFMRDLRAFRKRRRLF